MTGGTDEKPKPAKAAPTSPREARLAQALRANLRRRKISGATESPASSPAEPKDPH